MMMMVSLSRLAWIVLPFLPHVAQSTSAAEDEKADWYTRYPLYPQYCSTPEQMQARNIPPLQDNGPRVGETRLRHVTSIIRHGARTVFGNAHCWDGYWDDPESAIWDCDLTTLLALPTPQRVQEEEEATTMTADTTMFLFEKKYDALHDSEHGFTNLLNGTCQEAQLLLQGYEQQLTNGQHLRNAYLYQGGTYSHDERMRLFDTSQKTAQLDPWDEHNLYLRSDDDQRTLMSGQVLLRGLFQPELEQKNYQTFPTIPVHTADRKLDIVGDPEYHCPRLQELRVQADSSKGYKEYYEEQESQNIRAFMEDKLHSQDDSVYDCLVTSVCTDRPLPDAVQAYNPHPNSWFSRIGVYRAMNYSYHYRYNDAEYAKLAMGPLWAEIMDHILPVVNEDEGDRGRPPAKLAIYSGHDTTIMMILESLGSKVKAIEWPPYASMILIEIHEFIDDQYDRHIFQSNYAFRLLYNGKVLTSLMAGCPQDSQLCDANVLIHHVQQFATRAMDCSVPEEKSSPVLAAIKSFLGKTEGLLLVLIVVVIGAVIGAVTMFVLVTGALPTKNGLEVLEERKEREEDREGTSGLMNEEIELTFAADADSPFDESRLD